MKIIGSVLARNEDRFIERAVLNIMEFCDRVIVSDNGSRDRTWSILQRLAQEYAHMELGRISDTRLSHDLLRPFAGGDYWVFGVDGDEVYDPAGLKAMKGRLLAGEFSREWVVFGNVLNCTRVDEVGARAWGYLAPPSRSMTKLYNFAAIESWDGHCGHRLSGGSPRFRRGFDAAMRREIYKDLEWEQADFRCLHTCFTWRSSLDERDTDGHVARLNITESQGRTTWLRCKEWLMRLVGRRRNSAWKMEKYGRGPLLEKDIKAFLPQRREG